MMKMSRGKITLLLFWAFWLVGGQNIFNQLEWSKRGGIPPVARSVTENNGWHKVGTD